VNLSAQRSRKRKGPASPRTRRAVRFIGRPRRGNQKLADTFPAYVAEVHEFFNNERDVPNWWKTGFKKPEPPRREYDDDKLAQAAKRIKRLGERLVKEIEILSANVEVERLLYVCLHRQAGRTAVELERLLRDMASKGSVSAATELLRIGINAGERLKELARTKLDVLLPVSQRHAYWPVNYCPHREPKAEVEQLIKKLNLGINAPQNVGGKYQDAPSANQPFRNTLGNYARRIFLLVQSIKEGWTLEEQFAIQAVKCPIPAWVKEALSLPPFDKHSLPTVKRWFAVGWAVMCEAGGGDPRALPELGEIGKSRENVFERTFAGNYSTKAIRRQGAEQLREQLLKAFKSRYYSASQSSV
jgi:hypothetical protein